MTESPVMTRTTEAPLAWAARMFGCSRKTVVRMIEDDLIEGYQLRPGGHWRVDKESVQRYLETLRKRK